MFRRTLKILAVVSILVSTFGTGVQGSVISPTVAPVFTKISAGLYHTCAITDTEDLYCWGNNWYGQLGTGDTDPIEGKHLVQGDLTGKEVIDVSLGSYHTCAVTSERVVYCWGIGGSGVLGSGLEENFTEPLAIIGGPLSAALVNDVDAGSWNTCVNTTSGVICWGDNSFNQIQTGDPEANFLLPVAIETGVMGDEDAQDISVGEYSICSIVRAKAVCWGRDYTDRLLPHFMSRGYLRNKLVTKVDSGLHLCALTTLGTLACWGDNGSGQLGNGTLTEDTTPKRVLGGPLENALIEDFFTSDNGTCAITLRQKLACWGRNYDGQVGDGSTENRLSPVLVNTGALRRKKVLSVGMGENHTCAVTQAGRIACWGDNAQGQLGDGTTDDSLRPKFIVWE